MKIICIGLGSIGKRHCANLRQIAPDARIIMAEPRFMNDRMTGVYHDWRAALDEHADADGAIICSPTQAHLEQLTALINLNIPAYCEKPVMDASQYVEVNGGELPIAVGNQYRFHPAIIEADDVLSEYGQLKFVARDRLLPRYGRDVLNVMAAHPIDTALYFLGAAERVELHSDGVSVRGSIWHVTGGLSEYDIRMDEAPRVSRIEATNEAGNVKAIDLSPDDSMYQSALAAWLIWVATGKRDPRTATLADGLAAVKVMSQAKAII